MAKKSTVAFIKMTAKITPREERKDYGERAKRIKESFRSETAKIIEDSPKFLDEHICVTEMSEDCVKYGKRSFVKYTVYVKLFDDNNKDCAKELASTLNSIMEELLTSAQLKIV